MDIQAVLFDLDGTIIEPKQGIVNSILYAVKEFGLKENHPQSLTEFIGPPLQYSFKNRYNLSDGDAKEVVRLYRIYYADKGIFECHLYPQMLELIKKLFEEDIFLALATSKPIGYADQLLKHFELDAYFEFTAGAELDGTRTDKIEVIQYALDHIPPFEADQILMLGDREFDIDGGNFHNLQTAYAQWGYGDDAIVLKSKPDLILKQPLDLLVNLDL